MVDSILLNINTKESNFEFSFTIAEAQSIVELELYQLEETLNSIEFIKPECVRTDYALAIISGAICESMWLEWRREKLSIFRY